MKYIRLFENFSVREGAAAVAAVTAAMSSSGSSTSDRELEWKVAPIELPDDKKELEGKSGIVLLGVNSNRTQKVLKQFSSEWMKDIGKESDFEDYQDDMKLAYWNSKSEQKHGTFFKPDDRFDIVVPFSDEYVKGAKEEDVKKVQEWMSKADIKDKDNKIELKGLSDYLSK